MKDSIFTVLDNKRIASGTYEMRLSGDTSDIKGPGQFVNFSLEGFFLRRPISVCDRDSLTLTVIYKVVGKGTDAMSRLGTGDELQTLTGLGNGYDLSLSGERPLLIGGGAGVPPLYLLAKELVKAGKKPYAVLGFNSLDEIFYEKEFTLLGCDTTVTTVDGSYGKKGFVTDHLPNDATYFYACGPLPMLRSVYDRTYIEGQFSFEERMGCGFGACMGCSIRTKSGYKRVCKDGPVFRKEDILWQN